MTTSWRQHAACADESPELFFPIGVTGPALLQAAQAQEVCHGCPVMDRCGQWALDNNIEDGVWGGLTEDDRNYLRRRNSRQLADCGTEAAYRRHKKNDEPVDSACAEARRLAQAERAAKTKEGAVA